MQRPGNERVPGRAVSVAAQVDDLDLGHAWRRWRACGSESSGCCPRWLADSVSTEGVALPRTQTAPAYCARRKRHVASVIAKALVLLERRVVLLVDDDQPEIGDRREQRRARADGDLHPPPAERLPGILALPRGETAMKHCDVISEARPKRPTSCGVSAISGTSRTAPRPSLRTSSMARRYTSVLPEPVTPCSKERLARA